jgi:hypothetical protein
MVSGYDKHPPKEEEVERQPNFAFISGVLAALVATGTVWLFWN